MKKILFGVLIFLTVLNVVRFEIHMLLNPSLLIEKTSEDTLLSAIDYKLIEFKAKGLSSLKEIRKILLSISFCPIFAFETRSDKEHQTITYLFPLDPNPDSGQMYIHLRI
jgi:hypothetical protein